MGVNLSESADFLPHRLRVARFEIPGRRFQISFAARISGARLLVWRKDPVWIVWGFGWFAIWGS